MNAVPTNSGVLGVEKALTMQRRLWKYLQGGRVHHAILLTGDEPDTKLQVALGLAKALMCTGNPNGKSFCGTCTVCVRIAKEIHPDVLIIREPEEETLKIETIREVTYQMGILPLEGGRKVCIIDECHRMSPGASNAFLKTLEEPGEGRFFILLSTKPGSLLPTLLSRVVEFHFKPEGEMGGLLEEERVEIRRMLDTYLTSKDVAEFSAYSESRPRALKVIQYLESELHDAVQGKGLWSHLPALLLTQKFAAVVEAEGRLRSNAASGLMVENLLRQHFS